MSKKRLPNKQAKPEPASQPVETQMPIQQALIQLAQQHMTKFGPDSLDQFIESNHGLILEVLVQSKMVAGSSELTPLIKERLIAYIKAAP